MYCRVTSGLRNVPLQGEIIHMGGLYGGHRIVVKNIRSTERAAIGLATPRSDPERPVERERGQLRNPFDGPYDG